MAEWSIAAVLKTVEGHTSGGSNPSLSAKSSPLRLLFAEREEMRTLGFVIAQRFRSAAEKESLSFRKKQPLEAAFFALESEEMRTLDIVGFT